MSRDGHGLPVWQFLLVCLVAKRVFGASESPLEGTHTEAAALLPCPASSRCCLWVAPTFTQPSKVHKTSTQLAVRARVQSVVYIIMLMNNYGAIYGAICKLKQQQLMGQLTHQIPIDPTGLLWL